MTVNDDVPVVRHGRGTLTVGGTTAFGKTAEPLPSDDAPADEALNIELTGLEEVRVFVNNRVKMSPGKMAAQAIHATLLAYGIPHGRAVVLHGRPGQIEEMQAQVRDAGLTELAPGTLTAGASITVPEC